jgi:hypothetical protein
MKSLILSILMTTVLVGSLMSLVIISTNARYAKTESVMETMFPRDRMVKNINAKDYYQKTNSVKGIADAKVDMSGLKKELPNDFVNCVKQQLMKYDNQKEFKAVGLEEKAGFIRVYLNNEDKSTSISALNKNNKWVCGED